MWCAHSTLQYHTLFVSQSAKKEQKPYMKHSYAFTSIRWHEQHATGDNQHHPWVWNRSSFTCLLGAVITLLKMKIFIQQNTDLMTSLSVWLLWKMSRVTQTVHDDSSITTSYTDNSGRHKQTPYSLHKAAVQSVFYLNCKRWQRKKLVFSSTRSSSVAPYVWSFCGTPWPFRVDTTTVWSALRATGSRRTRRSCAAVQSADRPSPRDLRSTKTHCLRKLLRNWDRLECVPPPSLELRIKSMPKKSRTSSCSVRCVWLLFWL